MKTCTGITGMAARTCRWIGVSMSLLSVAVVHGCGDGTGGTGGGTSSGSASSSDRSSSGSGSVCASPSDCPETGSACVIRACTAGACVAVNLPEGTPLATQTSGDCQQVVCDGEGKTKSINDDKDEADDGKECTKDACSGGAPTHKPLAAGAACNEGGGKVCDGNVACVACVVSNDCGSGVCSQNLCVAATCVDGMKNGTESDVDCGGSCAPCGTGKVCGAVSDCASALCPTGKCASGSPTNVPISASGHDRFFGVTFGSQGEIYAVGVTAPGIDAATDFSTVVARFTPAGVLDSTFGVNGFAIKNITVGTNGEVARGIVQQSTGKLVVYATVDHEGAADPRDRDVALLRFNTNGMVDTTFGNNGVAILDVSTGIAVGAGFVADGAWNLALNADDSLIIHGSALRAGGMDSDFFVARVTPNGALDPTFGTNGMTTLDINQQNASARNVTILPDGSIMACGYMSVGNVTTPVVYKLTPSGKFDATFGTGGVFNKVVLPSQTETYSVGLQGTKLVTTGYGRSDPNTESLDWLSLRINMSGQLDPTYGNNGVARIDIGGFNDNSRQLVVLPDSRVVLVGGGRLTASDVDGVVALLTPGGQPDVTFSPTGWKTYNLGGPADFLWGVALAPSKNYLALAGINGAAAGGGDDGSLLLVPIK